jgi:hypothetical protein
MHRKAEEEASSANGDDENALSATWARDMQRICGEDTSDALTYRRINVQMPHQLPIGLTSSNQAVGRHVKLPQTVICASRSASAGDPHHGGGARICLKLAERMGVNLKGNFVEQRIARASNSNPQEMGWRRSCGVGLRAGPPRP